MNNYRYQFLNKFDVRLERRTTYTGFIARMTARERFEEVVPEYNNQEVLVVSIPEQNLDKIVNTLIEYDNLLKDPETRELVQQARFILELKGTK